jgi:hypothetical protein
MTKTSEHPNGTVHGEPVAAPSTSQCCTVCGPLLKRRSETDTGPLIRSGVLDAWRNTIARAFAMSGPRKDNMTWT